MTTVYLKDIQKIVKNLNQKRVMSCNSMKVTSSLCWMTVISSGGWGHVMARRECFLCALWKKAISSSLQSLLLNRLLLHTNLIWLKLFCSIDNSLLLNATPVVTSVRMTMHRCNASKGRVFVQMAIGIWSRSQTPHKNSTTKHTHTGSSDYILLVPF